MSERKPVTPEIVSDAQLVVVGEETTVAKHIEELRNRQAALAQAPDLADAIPDSEVLPPDDGEASSSHDEDLRRRVVYSLIKAHLAAGLEGGEEMKLGMVAKAIQRAGATMEQYLQMLEDPDFLDMKEMLERGVYLETGRPSFYAALRSSAAAGNMQAIKMALNGDKTRDGRRDKLISELYAEGEEGIKRRALELMQRMQTALTKAEPADIEDQSIAEARESVETRQSNELAIPQDVDEADFFKE